MSRKIFQSILIVTFTVLLLCMAIIMGALYSHFTEEQKEQMRNETGLVIQGIEKNGVSYFEGLEPVDFRVTWITSGGTILYDNAADSSEMENHLEREEIQSALETGYGESSRYSSTLLERQLYTARKLADGSVIRLSITQATIWNLFLRFCLPLGAVVGLAVLFSLFLASRLSARIMEPLNHINLNEPLQNMNEEGYSEIRPLLRRLDVQHKQLLKDREELERTSLIRQEFTANASHELKTPLHVISGYAELLESGMARDADISSFAGKIRSEAQRMTRLVDDIIDLSQLDSGAAGMAREETDLFRIARNAVNSLESTAEEKDVEIIFTGSPAKMNGIPHVLYSVVYNLCNNAIKYSNSGSQVFISVRKEDDAVVLTVQDYGIGIPEEDLDRIFERFYRVDKSHSKEVGGTGLGLSIVKHAARIHDARVTVTSKLGEGSVFTVYFPV